MGFSCIHFLNEICLYNSFFSYKMSDIGLRLYTRIMSGIGIIFFGWLGWASVLYLSGEPVGNQSLTTAINIVACI